MATPNYNALQAKVIQWANRDKEVFGVDANNPEGWRNYIGDFLSYAADEAYRLLRIPPLEYERVYTVEQGDIVGTPNISVLGTNNWAGTGGVSYCKIPVPVDFVEMKSIRFSGAANNTVNGNLVNPGIVFNERTDERTFFDIYAETYSNFYWMRKDNYIYIKPALAVGSTLTFSYYRELPALNADYSVVANNYLFGASDVNGIATQSSIQPFMVEGQLSLANGTGIGGYDARYPNRIFLSVQGQVNNSLEIGDRVLLTSLASANGLSLVYEASVSDVSALGTSFNSLNGVQYFDVNMPFSQDSYPTGGTITLTPAIYFITASGTLNNVTYSGQRIAAYNSMDDAATGRLAYEAAYPTLAIVVQGPVYFEGLEVGNWLKDKNERILIWGALMHAGAFLDDEKIESRYNAKFNGDINSLNHEERMRRAKGGNTQVHFNGGGLI